MHSGAHSCIPELCARDHNVAEHGRYFGGFYFMPSENIKFIPVHFHRLSAFPHRFFPLILSLIHMLFCRNIRVFSLVHGVIHSCPQAFPPFLCTTVDKAKLSTVRPVKKTVSDCYRLETIQTQLFNIVFILYLFHFHIPPHTNRSDGQAFSSSPAMSPRIRR